MNQRPTRKKAANLLKELHDMALMRGAGARTTIGHFYWWGVAKGIGCRIEGTDRTPEDAAAENCNGWSEDVTRLYMKGFVAGATGKKVTGKGRRWPK